MTQTIKDILAKSGKRPAIAKACKVEPIAVYRWGQNESIPAKYWGSLIKVAKRNNFALTADILCRVHDQNSPSSKTSLSEAS